jgi:hypothetical protein
VREITIATGTVLPKNKVLLASASKTWLEGRTAPKPEWCNTNQVRATAMAMLQKLNSTLTGITFWPLGRLWMTVELHAITSTSGKLNQAAEIRMKGKFTDIVPVRPGNFSFSREAMSAMSNRQANRT